MLVTYKPILLLLCLLIAPIELLANPVTLEQAVDMVATQQSGKVLKATTLDTQPPFYRIKVLADSGKVLIFQVNSETGKVSQLGKTK